ncbi:hypothetical protein FDUTEX481_03329 [Tolypothrix sp. PCC 7601]|nr:hypothetical protein FDUTEX481_03329 [Tolypothrix sp. PCC 7601]
MGNQNFLPHPPHLPHPQSPLPLIPRGGPEFPSPFFKNNLL